MLAIATHVRRIRVLEPGPEIDALQINGHFCFLIYPEIPHLLSDNIRLHQALNQLPGYPPHLIPAEAFTGIDLVTFQEHSIPIYPEHGL